MIRKKLTGHLYIGSAHETDDSCGNCDGAKCDFCSEKFASDLDIESWFSTREEASEWDELLTDEAFGLVGKENVTGPNMPDVEYYLNEWGELTASYYDSGYGYQGEDAWVRVKGSGQMKVICNPDAHGFDEKYAIAFKAIKEWANCPCVDKAEEECGNSCDIIGCNDSLCRREVKCQGRLQRKWYM